MYRNTKIFVCKYISSFSYANKASEVVDVARGQRVQQLLRPCVDYLLTLRFASGNCPSSLGSSNGDKLVHWCHGAPGWVYVFAMAYKVSFPIRVHPQATN